MKKIYLASNNNKMNETIIQEIKHYLIEKDEYIVFLNENNYKEETNEINSLMPDAYVYIGDSNKWEGITCVTDHLHDDRSSGLARQIYKELLTIYPYQTSKGVVFVNNEETIYNLQCPSTIINIGNSANTSDNVFKEKEHKNIAKKISQGIITYFTLKMC